jgi:outer membrane biosynthesis protein TonB
MLEDLPSSPTANDVTELTAYLGEMNRIRSNAQQAVAMLSAIPDTENDDSVAALAWGDAKQEYIDTIETRLEDLRGLIEEAQYKRADLQGSDAPEREPEPESEDSDENASPAPEPEPTEPPAEEQTATEPAPEQDPVEQTTVEPAADVPDNVETNDVETEDVPVTQPTSEDTAQPQSQVESSDPQLGTAQ